MMVTSTDLFKCFANHTDLARSNLGQYIFYYLPSVPDDSSLYGFTTQIKPLHSSDLQSPSKMHFAPISTFGFILFTHWNFLHSPDSHSPSLMHLSPIFAADMAFALHVKKAEISNNLVINLIISTYPA